MGCVGSAGVKRRLRCLWALDPRNEPNRKRELFCLAGHDFDCFEPIFRLATARVTAHSRTGRSPVGPGCLRGSHGSHPRHSKRDTDRRYATPRHDAARCCRRDRLVSDLARTSIRLDAAEASRRMNCELAAKPSPRLHRAACSAGTRDKGKRRKVFHPITSRSPIAARGRRPLPVGMFGSAPSSIGASSGDITATPRAKRRRAIRAPARSRFTGVKNASGETRFGVAPCRATPHEIELGPVAVETRALR